MRRQKTRSFLGGLLLLMTVSSHPQDLADSASAAYDLCLQRAGGATMDVLRCMETEFQQRDARLNQVYHDLLARLSPARREKLRHLQKLWVRYKEAKCAFFYDRESGSGGLEDMQACLLEETLRRTRELQGLL